ncbi:UvrD-helicase domain-containing protein [Tissierella sp. MSJ-40]|uniref:DNA 3'-5' helicase n=1 Tax=Tissierella simiarum TaxID=2841534 RepID=A0ABS6E3B7_9FIRM|nr:UvrD-helicase domain-containing protein [Tissierella simiarum]MBU5437401.1 UvrD-helicase domain-containing protein [Tissierella simiarum]
MEEINPQEIAITTIDKNIAVNAGAGTGKTKVLTERFVYILENGDLEEYREVESIVAITFTKKATQEMMDRIRKEIRKNFNKDPKWRRFYRDMEKANISTIHSFCSKILRENILEAKIDPLFTVLDDYTSSKLLKEAAIEELRKGIEEDERVYLMLRVFKENQISKLAKDFIQAYNLIRTVGLDFSQVKDMTLAYIDTFKITEEDISFIKDTFIYLMDRLPKNSSIYKLRDDPIWIKFFEKDYGEEELFYILEYLQGKIGSSTKEPEHTNKLKMALEKTALAKEKENKWIYETILDLLINIDKNYTLRKNEVSGLDYDDLQIIVLNLLKNDSIRKKYQNKFRYIMIDEFQDTNELQKKIFYKLATVEEKLDKSNLFVVGDPKQSIYGFRGADLDVFYDVILDVKETSNMNSITLQKNYRTVNTVLNFINNIFSQVMGDGYNELKEYHVSNNKIDVEIIEKVDLEIPSNMSKKDYSTYYESRMIAKRIKELVSKGEFKYRDFAMLFRASTKSHIYEEALKEYGIPYYNLGGKGYFCKQEVLDLINGLKAISNPFDTIANIGFLRSPMVGMADTTIYWLLREKENTLYKTMHKEISFLGEEEKGKIRKTRELLSTFYNKKTIYNISDIIEDLIETTCYLEILLLQQGGKQSVANIYKFIEIAEEYEKINGGTFEDFMVYIEEIRDNNESQAKVESEDADVVKILTIHKSKGLQFPVVIIPQMSSDNKGIYSSILFHKEKGIGLRTDNNRALYDEIRRDMEKKEFEESKRILYVAMTRAEKMLIIGNQGKDNGFKKLIKDFLDPKDYRLISEIDIEKEEYIPIKTIDDKFTKKEKRDCEKIPLLYEISGYNERMINSHSISQYLSFLDCKRRFYIDYYRKMPSIIEEDQMENQNVFLKGIDKGNIIHRFCQYYRLGLDENILIRKVCKSFGFNYNEELKLLLDPYIKNYINLYREDYDEFFVEKPFYIKVGNSHITGIIDRINIKDGKAEIVDFKTNRVYNKNKLIKKYKPQMLLYAYVVKEIMDISVDKAKILFLENGDSEDVLIEEEKLLNNLNNIQQFIDFVSINNNILDYEKSKKCSDYCEYKSLCSIE